MSEFNALYSEFQNLVNKHGFDFQKFNDYAIVHHSNAIENSTLTEDETIILLSDGLTPNSKPLQYTYMAIDHYNALKFVVNMAENKHVLTVGKIQDVSALVLNNTGEIVNSALGTVDSTKGDFRKFTVRAGNNTFMDYKKVPSRVKELSHYIQNNIDKANTIEENYKLAFEAHYQLVTIHPFADGNGRTSRLIMNYIQHYQNYPMTLVFAEDKASYFEALNKTRADENISLFTHFMMNQAKKYFKHEIGKMSKETKEIRNQRGGMKFIF